RQKQKSKPRESPTIFVNCCAAVIANAHQRFIVQVGEGGVLLEWPVGRAAVFARCNFQMFATIRRRRNWQRWNAERQKSRRTLASCVRSSTNQSNAAMTPLLRRSSSTVCF